jgi:hypothetical protein
MINNNFPVSNQAFKKHYFTFGNYRYKLQLKYITPDRNYRNTKWILTIDGITNKSDVTIDRLGNMTSEESIVESLIFNLEGHCEISNSKRFAKDIISNIKELSQKYLEK